MPIELFTQVEAQFRARRQAYLDAVAQEQEASNQARAELQAAKQVASKLSQTLPSYQQSAEAYRKLVQEGFIGELAAAERTREAIEKQQDLRAQESNVESLQAAIAQSERKIAALRSQYRSQLENERLDTMTLLNRVNQELSKSNVRAGLLEIRAPHGGIVKDVATTSRGSVVAAGNLLMSIVPTDEPLQAEVSLRNEDAGFVVPGQAVKLKVAAYPFQKYGMLDGKVALVSADAAEALQRSAEDPEPLSYKAIVRLESTSFVGYSGSKALQLSPGMLVSAEVHQGRRTVLEYLLSPVQRVAQEAARER